MKKVTYLLFCILVLTAHLFFINFQLNKEKSIHLNNLTQNAKTNFDVLKLSLEKNADIYAHTMINNKTKEIFANKDLEALYSKLKDYYSYIAEQGFKIVHFHFPNNQSFLRMHKPEKYGDDLSNIRYTVAYVNKNHESLKGLETGRAGPAFRNIYPLFLKEKYIGCVEISFEMDKFLKVFEKLYNTHTHFILSEKTFENKMFFTDISKHYQKFEYHDSYVEKINKSTNHLIKAEDVISSKDNLKNLIKQKINNKASFSLEIDTNHSYTYSDKHIHYVVTYLAINNFKNEHLGYLIFYKKAPELKKIEKDYFIYSLLGSIIIILAFILLYKKLNATNELKKMVDIQTKTLNETYKKLKEQHKYLNKIINSQPNFTLLTNGEELLETNRCMLDFFGYKTLEDFKKDHMCICEFFIDDNGYLPEKKDGKNWIELLLDENEHYTHAKIYDTSNNPHIFQIKISNADESNQFVVIFVDNTELVLYKNSLEEKVKERTIELKEAKELAEESAKIKSEFLANMSHEIRTPLAGIIGLIDILIEDKDLEDSKKDEYLQIIKYSSDGLKNIINDILDYSKIQAGKFDIISKEFDFNNTINNTFQIFNIKIKDKNTELILDVDDTIPNKLLGDELRLTQILNNLIGNAVKFTQKGFVKLKVEKIKHANDNLLLKFTVSDSGIGMSQEVQKNLFKAFTQGELSNTKNYQGTGLGLVISKKLTELMSGNIAFSSEEGKGSTFIFVIPLKVYKDKENENYYEVSHSKEIFNITRKALVAEDEKANQIIIKTILKKLNFDIDFANNGLEALEKAKSNHYDVIFMDIQMPNMDGLEASSKIREFDKNTPIIALSAAAFNENKEESKKAGMNEHIAKPFTKEELIYVLNQILNTN